MPKNVTVTAAATAGAGPFPPNYPAGAYGFTAAGSNPSGAAAGSLSSSTYFGANILALCNDVQTNPTQLLVALAGTYDQSFLGGVETSDSVVYSPTAATFINTLVNGSAVTLWIWPLAGVKITNGAVVTLLDTADTLVQLQGYSQSSTQINLSWANTGPTPPSNYQLWRGVGTATPTLYQTLSGTTTTYSDTGLTANQEYNYYVLANYSDGTVAASLQLQLFTPASGVSATFNCNCQAVVPDNWTTDTLANLRKRVIIRAGYGAQAANPPPGMVVTINEYLRTAQNQLYRNHTEFRNRRMYAWQMEPNIRYYGLTQDESGCKILDPMSIDWVGFEDLNQAWYPLVEGIDPVLYTRAQISTGWPTHYEIKECIEIFPAPRAAYTLWIKGRFGLQSFVNDTDVTTIDAESIYLLAAGMYMTQRNNPEANSVMTQASNYVQYLVAGQHGTRRYVPRTRVQTPMTPPRFLPLEE